MYHSLIANVEYNLFAIATIASLLVGMLFNFNYLFVTFIILIVI